MFVELRKVRTVTRPLYQQLTVLSGITRLWHSADRLIQLKRRVPLSRRRETYITKMAWARSQRRETSVDPVDLHHLNLGRSWFGL